jgi:hypothetical protein
MNRTKETGGYKPVYGFCLGDQGEFFGCKKFTETIKVLLPAEVTKMVQEIVEMFRFLQRKNPWTLKK